MDVLKPPKARKNNKNHGGGHRQLQQQQRRYYNQHNPNYNPLQYQRDGKPRLPFSPFFIPPAPVQPQKKANVARTTKNKLPDDQELICSKCARYYQVLKDNQQPGFDSREAHSVHNRYQTFQYQQAPQHVRFPYVLPCDHTICGDCIKLAYPQRVVKCPECDVCAAIDIDNAPDASFAINYYLIGRIYLMNHQMPARCTPAGGSGEPVMPRLIRASPPQPLLQQAQQLSHNYLHSSRQSLQGSCGEGDLTSLESTEMMSADRTNQILKQKCSMGSCTAPAAVNCVECESIFCTACSNVLHGGEIAGLKDHRIRPVQRQLLSYCPQHSANVLDFHCVACDVDLCCYCFIEGGHAGHEHVRLTVLNEDQKVGFKELISNVEDKLMKLENAFKITEQHINASLYSANRMTGRNKNHEQVVANVNKHFADLIAKLLNTHHRLRQKLDSAQNASVEGLRLIQSDVAHRLSSGRSLLSQGRLVLETSDSNKAGSALINVALLRQELEQMLEWPSCLVDGRNGDDKTSAHIEFISDLSENLDKFCALKVQDADQFQLVHDGKIPEGFALATLPKFVQQPDIADSSSQSSYSENASSIASTSKQSDFARPIGLQSALSVSKMPPVKQMGNIAASPVIGGRHAVTVVHVNSPESIFIQLIDNLPILKQIHNDLANYVKSLSASEVTVPQMGECYIVKQNIHWVRARCIKQSQRSDFLIVQLLETGQTIEVLKLHMRECNQQFRQIPPMAYHCRLQNLYPNGKGWSTESKKLLENILSLKSGYTSPFGSKYKHGGTESCNVTMHVVGHQNGTFNVHLVASRDDTNTMLSHALLFTGLAKVSDSTNDEFESKSFVSNKIYDNTKMLQVHQRVRVSVIHVKDPYNIYVHLTNVLSHITDLLRNMNNYYLENNRGIVYTPRIGMFVAIQYSENQTYNWYRGKIMKVMTGVGKVDVLLIDFGRIVNVDYKNLRALDQKFTVLECQAIHIRLADIAPPSLTSNNTEQDCDYIWPDPTMEFLREYVKHPGHHLEIAIAEGAQKHTTAHTVVLFECLPHVHYCINAQLVEAGLARSTGKLSSSDNIEWPQDLLTNPSMTDGVSSDDNHNVNKRGGVNKRRGDASLKQSQDSTDSTLRMIEGTPSFTLDLVNTIQGSQEDVEEDDDDEEGQGDKGRVEVDVLLIKSPDEIYVKVKSRDPEVLQIEPTLMREMHQHYAVETERVQSPDTWQKGDNIVAYNRHSAQYHRGTIRQVLGDGKDGNYIVLCRDRAIEFKVDHLSIYPLHENFIQIPYLSKRIRLANIQPMNNKWPLIATDIINSMCNLGNAVDIPSGGQGLGQKYYYRKTRDAHTMEDGEITQPGILWVCKLISCGPLERSKYQYRSVNKQLLRAGVAVSDMHKNPFILRRTPPEPTTEPQPSEEPTPAVVPPIIKQQNSVIGPSYTAEILRRAFCNISADDDLSSSDALSGRDEEKDASGGGESSGGGTTSGSEVCSTRRKRVSHSSAEHTSSGASVGSNAAEEEQLPPITAYLPALPLPERRFLAEATYVDEAAHIYLHPEQLAPILATLSETIQKAVRVYNQKVLLPSPNKRPTTYKVEELCIVRYHLDKKWYRGKITHVIPYISEDFGFEYRVQLVDFGNVEQVRSNDLNKLVLCPTVPLVCTKVRLHQLETKCGPWNTSVLDTIHSLVVDKILDVSLCDKTSPIPDAIVRIDGLIINEYLLKEFDCLCRGNDTVASDHDSEEEDVVIIEESDSPEATPVINESQSIFSFDQLELMPKLEVGHKRTVKVIDILNINIVTVEMVPDNMSCLKSKYEEIFSSFNNNAIEHVQLNDIRPSVNCLARFSVDGLYYRAEIMSILPPTTSSSPTMDSSSAASSVAVHVFFIDYGNREIVQRGHLRSLGPYDPLVRRLPALARMVALHRVRLPPSMSPTRAQDALLDRMTDLLQQKEFVMEIVRNEPRFSVNLLDPQSGRLVYESLISEGLVVYADRHDSDDDYE